jgi:tripartite-type tricarboxylate transporter receptor subunit TctC
LGNEAKKYLGQEVIVVNKPGAAATVAATQVAMAKPDGYTLGVCPSITFTSSQFLLEVPVDLVKESTPILSFARFNVGIVVKSDSPFRTLKDFFGHAKQNPGKDSYWHPGAGTKPHLVIEMIIRQEGIKVNPVAFSGDATMVAALLGGHITVGGGSAGGWISQVQGGMLRLVAVIEEERMDLFPEIPTVVELGYPFPIPIKVFLYGPKGLSEPIVKKLEDSFNMASQSPIYRKVAVDNALYDKKNIFREQLATFLLAEKTKTGEIIQKLGLIKR